MRRWPDAILRLDLGLVLDCCYVLAQQHIHSGRLGNSWERGYRLTFLGTPRLDWR